MRPNKRLIALTLSAVLLLSVIGPGLAMADEHETDDSETELNVAVSDLTVSVTDGNGSAVENATVNVTLDDENATYNGTGDYTTDENGTVELPAPEETVNVSVTAAKDNVTASTTATLEAAEEDDEEEDGSNDAFGQDVQAYVHALMNGEGSDVPMGHHVAEFVTENNPGNAPDHAGPKNDTGMPDHAGPDEDKRGPPDHAGPDKDKNEGKNKGGQDAGTDDVSDDGENETDDGEE